MPFLTVGKTTIPYSIRVSERARRRRITVTPGLVEVTVPAGAAVKSTAEFVEKKSRWIVRSLATVGAQPAASNGQRHVSGAKILYRGRRLMLRVEPADVEDIEIRCRGRFLVRVPKALPKQKYEPAVAVAMEAWLKARAQSDIAGLAKRYAEALDVELVAARISDHRKMWGECDRNGVVRINWRLIQAPRAALEYVVAHELCHVRVRNHSPEFWKLLGTAMPDWEVRKQQLERWERLQETPAVLQ